MCTYCMAQVCPKTGPAEAIGVLCVRDGRNAVVEYSDLPAELKNLRCAGGGSCLFGVWRARVL